MSGNCDMGSLLKVSAPAKIMATAITMAKIGRWMKNLENMAATFCQFLPGAPSCRRGP